MAKFEKGKINGGKQFSSEYQPNKEIWTEEESLRLFSDMIDWMNASESNLIFDEFFLDNKNLGKYANGSNINRNTIDYLCDKFASCSTLYALAKEKQKIRLQKCSLFDKINPGFAKFMLACNHGFKEVSKVENVIDAKISQIIWKEEKTYEAKPKTNTSD